MSLEKNYIFYLLFFKDISYNATSIDVEFLLRWTEPKYPNCDITHYSIYISGGVEGIVTLPQNKREYVFKKNMKLSNVGVYSDKAVVSDENLTLRIFQFEISADSSVEDITGNPSFFTADLNNFQVDKLSNKDKPNSIDELSFNPVRKILVHDNTERKIKVIDTDTNQVIQTHRISISSNPFKSDSEETKIK